jgi:hypothetical protein
LDGRTPTQIERRRPAKSDGVPGGGAAGVRERHPHLTRRTTWLARPSRRHGSCAWPRAKSWRVVLPPGRAEDHVFGTGGGGDSPCAGFTVFGSIPALAGCAYDRGVAACDGTCEASVSHVASDRRLEGRAAEARTSRRPGSAANDEAPVMARSALAALVLKVRSLAARETGSRAGSQRSARDTNRRHAGAERCPGGPGPAPRAARQRAAQPADRLPPVPEENDLRPGCPRRPRPVAPSPVFRRGGRRVSFLDHAA